MGFSVRTVGDRVHPCCPFSHPTGPPETELPRLQVHSRPPIDALFCLAAVAQTGTKVAEIALLLDRAPDYKSTTVASIIVPAVMTSHRKPVLQFPVGITINEERTTIPGQTPWHQCLLGQQTAEFVIRPLAPQGLRYPRNLYGFSRQPTGMSRSHAQNVLRLHRRDVPLCSFHPLLSMQLHPPRRTGASVLLRTTTRRPAEDVPTPQEPLPDRSLSVRNDNQRTAELHLAPEAIIDCLPSLDPETLPSLKTTMHAESDALPQDAKVAQSRLDSSPTLRRDSHLQKEVIRTLLWFANVISIRATVRLTSSLPLALSTQAPPRSG